MPERRKEQKNRDVDMYSDDCDGGRKFSLIALPEAAGETKLVARDENGMMPEQIAKFMC